MRRKGGSESVQRATMAIARGEFADTRRMGLVSRVAAQPRRLVI